MATDLSKFAADQGIKYFMISYTDLFGAQRAKLVPAAAISDMQRDGADGNAVPAAEVAGQSAFRRAGQEKTAAKGAQRTFRENLFGDAALTPDGESPGRSPRDPGRRKGKGRVRELRAVQRGAG